MIAGPIANPIRFLLNVLYIGMRIIAQMIIGGHFIVADYKQILVIGCEEASKWSTSEHTLDVNANLELASLEEELQIRGQPIHVLDFCSCPPMSLRELILN
jgi:hypothetical protein